MPSFESMVDRPIRSATNHLRRFACALVGGGIICVVGVGAATAQKNVSKGLSVTEALNEQQLQILKTMPRDNSCIEKSCTPQPLSNFLNKKQTQECNVGKVSQAPAQDAWALLAGGLVGQQITNWGQAAGWQVIWHVQKDWTVPSSVEFHGDFTTATTQLLEDLADEGASIHAIFYQGNHTLVVTGDDQ